MRIGIAVTLLFASLAASQTPNFTAAAQRLQDLLNLPLNQRVQERTKYKTPALSAYHRQIAPDGNDCGDEARQGQQPYNICMGKAAAQADKDFADFYSNLELLMWTQDDLRRLEETQAAWLTYRDKATAAAAAALAGGTAASGEASAVYLALTRDRMRELYRIYGLNFAQ